jgi:hypothetical protein
MKQNVSTVVVALDAYLEQLKERSILGDELVSKARRLRRGVSGIFASEEGDRGFGDVRMIAELQANVVRRSYGLERHVSAAARWERPAANIGPHKLSSHCK